MDMLFTAYPPSLYATYLLSRLASGFRASRGRTLTRKQPSGSFAIAIFHTALCGNLVATAVIACYALASKSASSYAWWSSSDYLASILGVAAFFAAGLLPDADFPYTPASWHATTWVVCLAFEIATLSLALKSNISCPLRSVGLDIAQYVLLAARIVLLLVMVITFWWPKVLNTETPITIEETEPLLNAGGNLPTSGYGVSRQKLLSGGTTVPRAGDAQTTDWVDYTVGFKNLFPFLWPSDSRTLQIRSIFCFFLLICQRVVNILVPRQLGIVVAMLRPGKIPHMQLLTYILLRGLQGQQGVIGSIRALLWIPISQSTYRRLTSAAFEHVLLLSLDFHLNNRIGEVLSALSKGSALNTFLDGFAFQLLPMVADLWIAAVYFMIEYDFFYALAVISITWTYLYVTIYMAKYRGRARREMTMREREIEAAKTEALMSYETVHHNSATETELSRFQRLVSVFQGAEFKVFFSLNLLNAVQNGVFTFGVLVLCYLNAFQISQHQTKVANFVTLLTYLAQLQAPLNFFGSFYTQVQNNLVDAERMLDLFKEETTIIEKPNAKPLAQCSGSISFQAVEFAYTKQKCALQYVSFTVPPGTSTAIVGESGSGKSTILKLLFRFYDCDAGTIAIDGVDIKDITVASLRSHFGIVPQDTILFHETIMYNLIYARPDATEDEVYEACRSASIHDKILSFPQGYATVVGERGLKLSGGEKQRISIARAMLRRPKILLLDEATASLDSATERQIQGALEKVSQGRTTITIAHRLSTITKSDQIIVLHEGQIAEKGTHAQLLALGGRYSQMWNKQTQEETAVE
ncbi:P-loop containing nucleoside triphosphate hydrolase protein [Nemania sp. FL0031]|nr:P-loop containing nucleoside triphosphate hydrolase protein [Nemania sp. FL0031]